MNFYLNKKFKLHTVGVSLALDDCRDWLLILRVFSGTEQSCYCNAIKVDPSFGL